jgi:hypothetical protein
LNLAAVIGGISVIFIALRDIFQAVIIPRASNVTLRVSRYMFRAGWRIWPRVADLLYPRDADRREDFLGAFAPFEMVSLLVVWVAMLLLGWGLFFYGIRSQLHPSPLSLVESIYYAGVSLLTIGYGDIVPQTTLARFMSVFAGASGLGVVAVVISFLFSTFGAFQRRERFVVTLGARAGIPPSGLGLLLTHADAGIRSDVAQVLREGQEWTASVMETHLAYPILIMFRSSHDYDSWVGTLGTLMDAASLVISTLDPKHLENPQSRGQARIMYELGRHLVRDFSSYFNIGGDTDRQVGIERYEFDAACEHLRDAGFVLRDREPAWQDFSSLRSAYAQPLNALARWLQIPPLQWIGDRSLIARQKAHIT